MKSRIIIFILMAYLILPTVYAASISISQAGADSNTVMKGASFTVTVSDLSGTGSATLTLPTGFSTEENTTKTFGGSTTTVSWTTVVANQKLSAQTISASITTTGSPETATSSSFDVILPPSIVTTVSPSSMAASSGSSYTINLNIQNNGETTAKDVAVTLSLPSGFSLTSGSSTQTISTISGGTGGGGETVGISWIVTASSPSSSTITITISPSNADSKTDTITVTAASTTTTTPGSSNNGGSVYGGTTTQSKSRHNYTEMNAGVVHKIKISDKEIGFKQITIEVRNKANNVTITITKLAGQPATVVHNVTGNVYQYIEITHDNLSDSNIKSASVRFNVSKSWLSTNGFTASDISLRRYSDDVWSKLPTEKISEDSNAIEYEATVPGLSVFAVVAEAVTSVTTTTFPTTTTIPATTTTTIAGTSATEYSMIILIALIIVIVVLVLAYFLRRKKPSAEKSSKSKQE
jgi:PGF-pre-PGF domain-containing protein